MTAASRPDIAEIIGKMTPLELLRVAPMDEASRLAGASVDTLERHHGEKIVTISPRRRGMRVLDALLIT